MAHRTRKVAIKWANIDIPMIPLIRWMNELNGITTFFCCQKDEKGLAQVVFETISQEDLRNFIVKFNHMRTYLCGFCRTWEWIDVVVHEGHIRYNIKMSQEDLKTINKFLKKKENKTCLVK